MTLMENVGSITDIEPAQRLFAKLRLPKGVCCPHGGYHRVYRTKNVRH
jgi:hypothetical protein